MYTLRLKLSREYSYNEIWDLESRIFVNAENFLQKSTLQSETHSNWVLKNLELYWDISPKLVDHWWDLRLCYIVSNSSWLWCEQLKSLTELLWLWIKETLRWNIWVTKYYLDLEIEILDIYPFIALVEAF